MVNSGDEQETKRKHGCAFFSDWQVVMSVVPHGCCLVLSLSQDGRTASIVAKSPYKTKIGRNASCKGT